MIPNPHRSDISVDLIKKILRQGEISRDELAICLGGFQPKGRLKVLSIC